MLPGYLATYLPRVFAYPDGSPPPLPNPPFIDIYHPQSKGLEAFVKTDFQNRGKDLGGIIWEEDPVRHRDIAKRISPAFSARAIRATEGLVHEYFDFFVERMKELGPAPEGVGLVDWTHWVASDLATDLTWNEQLHEMRDSTWGPTLFGGE